MPRIFTLILIGTIGWGGAAYANDCEAILAQTKSRPALSERSPRSVLRKWSTRTFLGLALSASTYAGVESALTQPETAFFPARHALTSPAPVLRVALLGDSLSRDFHLDSTPSMIWSMRTRNQGGWFLDDNPDPSSPRGFLERASEDVSILGRNHSKVSAYVDNSNVRPSPVKECIGNVCGLAEQVDAVLAEPTLPDLAMMWIGHNNLDWKSLGNQPKDFPSLARQIVGAYRNQVLRLREGFRADSRRHAIVVFGLIDFRSFFRARDEADAMKQADPSLYPHFDHAYEVFPSMKPENRDRMIELADLVNDGLEEMVRLIAGEEGNISVVFSRAFSTAPIDSAVYLSPEDGWHPSPSGHSLLAEAAYRDLVEVFRYLTER